MRISVMRRCICMCLRICECICIHVTADMQTCRGIITCMRTCYCTCVCICICRGMHVYIMDDVLCIV